MQDPHTSEIAQKPSSSRQNGGQASKPVSDSATFTTSEASDEDLGDLLLEVLPPDGSTMGNASAREALSRAADRPISEADYEEVRDKALALGLIRKGRGRGGSIALGRHYRLKVQEGHQVGVCLSGGYLRATVRPTEQGEQREARIQQYLQSWYRSRALERLQQKTDRYAQQIGVSPSGVSIRNFRSRWGSCNKRGQVVFNWNIIKAPHSIVDYVVIHELCHLIHPNHSKDFWAAVGRHDAAYPEHRQWLKGQGLRLLR